MVNHKTKGAEWWFALYRMSMYWFILKSDISILYTAKVYIQDGKIRYPTWIFYIQTWEKGESDRRHLHE